jgi:hypothetical protein
VGGLVVLEEHERVRHAHEDTFAVFGSSYFGRPAADRS